MKEFLDYTVELEQWQQKSAGPDTTGQQFEKIVRPMLKHVKNVKSLEV